MHSSLIAAVVISSAFAIGKSSNRNQVHYAVDVDGDCALAGTAPVRPYWRMLERSADATEPLGGMEEHAFGLAKQLIDANAHDVTVAVRAMPTRPITIHTSRAGDGKCVATAHMNIAGTFARVDSIWAKQKLFGVDYVMLRGLAPNGEVVQERISP